MPASCFRIPNGFTFSINGGDVGGFERGTLSVGGLAQYHWPLGRCSPFTASIGLGGDAIATQTGETQIADASGMVDRRLDPHYEWAGLGYASAGLSVGFPRPLASFFQPRLEVNLMAGARLGPQIFWDSNTFSNVLIPNSTDADLILGARAALNLFTFLGSGRLSLGIESSFFGIISASRPLDSLLKTLGLYLQFNFHPSPDPVAADRPGGCNSQTGQADWLIITKEASPAITESEGHYAALLQNIKNQHPELNRSFGLRELANQLYQLILHHPFAHSNPSDYYADNNPNHVVFSTLELTNEAGRTRFSHLNSNTLNTQNPNGNPQLLGALNAGNSLAWDPTLCDSSQRNYEYSFEVFLNDLYREKEALRHQVLELIDILSNLDAQEENAHAINAMDAGILEADAAVESSPTDATADTNLRTLPDATNRTDATRDATVRDAGLLDRPQANPDASIPRPAIDAGARNTPDASRPTSSPDAGIRDASPDAPRRVRPTTPVGLRI